MRREGTVTVLRAGVTDDAIVTLRRHRSSRRREKLGRPRLLRRFERLSCSRLRCEQLAPYVEERRPTSTVAPSRTNPATTGTEIATPVSREPRRTPSRPTSLTVMAASDDTAA